MKTKTGVFLCLFLAATLAVPPAFAGGPPHYGAPGGPGGFAPRGSGHHHGGGPGWWWAVPGPWYIGPSPFFFYPPFPAAVPVAPLPPAESGPVWVLREGVDRNGNLCREFQQTVNVGGGPEQIHGIACRRPDGTWQIVSG